MRKMFLAAVAALAVASARPAAADTIPFDYSGGGCAGGSTTCISLDSFDWLQGNSMVIENADGTGTILYQANLSKAVTPGTPLTDIPQGTGGNFFTAVAAFSVTFTSPGTFTVDSGGAFAIFYDTTGGGNDLAGTGFTSGTEILSGTALTGGGSFGFFSQTVQTCGTGASAHPCNLDEFNANDYPNFLTLSGAGGSSVDVLIDGVNPLFFPTLIPGESLSFVNTSLIDPYREINPSATFFGSIPGVSSTCGPGQLGTAASPCINGTGNNIMTQADANTTFQTTPSAAVPEPASLLLLGSGLLGSGFLRRRRASKA